MSLPTWCQKASGSWWHLSWPVKCFALTDIQEMGAHLVYELFPARCLKVPQASECRAEECVALVPFEKALGWRDLVFCLGGLLFPLGKFSFFFITLPCLAALEDGATCEAGCQPTDHTFYSCLRTRVLLFPHSRHRATKNREHTVRGVSDITVLGQLFFP